MKMHKAVSITLSLALLVATMATTAFAAVTPDAVTHIPTDPTAQEVVATTPAAGEVAAPATGVSPVEVKYEARIFKVQIPTSFPVYVDAEGVVYKAANTKIVNLTDSPIKIVSAKVAAHALSGYTLVEFTKNFKSTAIGTKEIGMKLFEVNVPTDGNAVVSAANLQLIPGNDGAAGGTDEVNVAYDVVLPAQNRAVSHTPMDITFTVDWNGATEVPGV